MTCGGGPGVVEGRERWRSGTPRSIRVLGPIGRDQTWMEEPDLLLFAFLRIIFELRRRSRRRSPVTPHLLFTMRRSARQ